MSVEMEEKKGLEASNVDEIKKEEAVGEITHQAVYKEEQDQNKEDESKYLSLSQVELRVVELRSSQLL